MVGGKRDAKRALGLLLLYRDLPALLAVMKGVTWFVYMMVAFNMVAVLSAMPGDPNTKAADQHSAYSITKLVGAVPKLTKDNYHLWLASILTVLMTGAMYLKKPEESLRRVQSEL